MRLRPPVLVHRLVLGGLSVRQLRDCDFITALPSTWRLSHGLSLWRLASCFGQGAAAAYARFVIKDAESLHPIY